MKTQTQPLRIEGSKVDLTTTHKGEDITFIHPFYGPNNYVKLKEEIEKDNLITPTFSEITSLLHTAFNSNDKYSKKIVGLMESNRLCGFTGILHIPKKGAYIKDKPDIRNGMPFMEESDLIKRLENNDPSVRFVEFGYQIGEMKSLDLARNPFVQALVDGEENAEKLAEIADKYSKNPYVLSFKSVNQPETRVAALDSDWYLGRRLGVGGVRGDWYGYALGVKKTGEASPAKK